MNDDGVIDFFKAEEEREKEEEEEAQSFNNEVATQLRNIADLVEKGTFESLCFGAVVNPESEYADENDNDFMTFMANKSTLGLMALGTVVQLLLQRVINTYSSTK